MHPKLIIYIQLHACKPNYLHLFTCMQRKIKAYHEQPHENKCREKSFSTNNGMKIKVGNGVFRLFSRHLFSCRCSCYTLHIILK